MPEPKQGLVNAINDLLDVVPQLNSKGVFFWRHFIRPGDGARLIESLIYAPLDNTLTSQIDDGIRTSGSGLYYNVGGWGDPDILGELERIAEENGVEIKIRPMGYFPPLG